MHLIKIEIYYFVNLSIFHSKIHSMGCKSLFMLTLIALVHFLGWVLSGSEWLSLGLSPLSSLPPLTDTSSGSEEEGGQGEGTPTSSQGSVSMEHWISRAIHQGSTTSSSSSSTQSGGSGAAGRLADVLAQAHVGKSGNTPLSKPRFHIYPSASHSHNSCHASKPCLPRLCVLSAPSFASYCISVLSLDHACCHWCDSVVIASEIVCREV